MEVTPRIVPAMNFSAFQNETPTDNNSPQVPKPRMLLKDLKKWPHEDSVTTYLLSVGFSSQKKVLCRAARQPPGISENTDIISEEQESTNQEVIRLGHYKPAQVL